jgi:hypothetical protein
VVESLMLVIATEPERCGELPTLLAKQLEECSVVFALQGLAIGECYMESGICILRRNPEGYNEVLLCNKRFTYSFHRLCKISVRFD